MTDKDIDDSRRHINKWVSDPRIKRETHDDPIKQLAKDIAFVAEKDLRLVRAFGKLQFLSTWFGMCALDRLLHGDQAGWLDMHRSFLYRAWHARINGGYCDIGWSKASFHIWEVGLGFAHAFAVGEDSFADWQAVRFMESLAGKNDKYRDWRERSFEIFMVKLYAMWRSLPLEISSANAIDLGIYQEILDNWHDPQRLRDSLFEACEHHWRETFDLEELGHVGAFEEAPYAQFPVEIIAIRRVREDQGLAMPKFEHPLMSTALASPPKVMPEVRDEVLERLIARARAEGSVGNPW